MSWIILILAGFFEVAFVVTMKLSNGFRDKKYTILSVLTGALSFFLLSVAMKELPVGTGYAVWTGLVQREVCLSVCFSLKRSEVH